MQETRSADRIVRMRSNERLKPTLEQLVKFGWGGYSVHGYFMNTWYETFCGYFVLVTVANIFAYSGMLICTNVMWIPMKYRWQSLDIGVKSYVKSYVY